MEQVVAWDLMVALLCHFAFLIFALINLFRGVTGRALLLAVLFSCVWLAALIHPFTANFRVILEIFVLLAWQGLILRAVGFRFRERRNKQSALGWVATISLVSGLVGIAIFLTQLFEVADVLLQILPLCFLTLNITGLVLIEQLARNVVEENVWRIRYLNIGLGLIFGFGVLLWSLRLAIGIEAEFLAILQPLVASLAIAPLAIASLRNSSNRLRFNLSRQFVFRAGTLAVTGGFLLSLSLMTYIGQLVGGDLGLSIAVFLGIVLIVLLLVIIGSSRYRSTARVLLTKTFFESRYDYRDEWRTLTQRLSDQGPDHRLVDHVQITLANILYAKDASLWLRVDSGFLLEASLADDFWGPTLSETCSEAICQFYRERDWVLDFRDAPDQAAVLIQKIEAEQPGAAFLVPLFLSDSLYAICFVSESEVETRKLDWEDFDILKMIARQSASFLALASADRALIEHEKFAAVAQMSAFLTHDIKTINAQLVLLLENAEKHKRNPAFVDDMLKTIKNSTDRMTNISTGLRNPSQRLNDSGTLIELGELLRRWHALDMTHEPRISIELPKFEYKVPSDYKTSINHIARNALESSSDARLNISVNVDSNFIYIQLKDTGPGMSEDFIRNRLFKPFDSSKGVTGMGIGSFQAKSIVERHGGELTVRSTLGKGTLFTITFPTVEVT